MIGRAGRRVWPGCCSGGLKAAPPARRGRALTDLDGRSTPSRSRNAVGVGSSGSHARQAPSRRLLRDFGARAAGRGCPARLQLRVDVRVPRLDVGLGAVARAAGLASKKRGPRGGAVAPGLCGGRAESSARASALRRGRAERPRRHGSALAAGRVAALRRRRLRLDGAPRGGDPGRGPSRRLPPRAPRRRAEGRLPPRCTRRRRIDRAPPGLPQRPPEGRGGAPRRGRGLRRARRRGRGAGPHPEGRGYAAPRRGRSER